MTAFDDALLELDARFDWLTDTANVPTLDAAGAATAVLEVAARTADGEGW